jgi:hypothetical protein
MLSVRPTWIAIVTVLQLSLSLTSALAQSDKPKQRVKQPTATAPSNVPDCSKFQDWSFGQQCRRNDGKTCQVMGQRADPSELKYCK